MREAWMSIAAGAALGGAVAWAADGGWWIAVGLVAGAAVGLVAYVFRAMRGNPAV